MSRSSHALGDAHRVAASGVFLRPRLWLGTLLALLFACPVWGQSYQLVWEEEFEGTQLDPAKWDAQVGDGCPQLCGWGNNELQYYRAENATVADGFLTITALEETFGGYDYTSARIRTKTLGDWTYGRFEMRAKMPIGRGLWPAFWMLPTDEVYGTWAASGEIDIMECLGQQPDRVFGTIHFGGTFPANQSSSNSFTLGAGTFNDDFHEFALEWDPCEMRWYVDGNLYATQTDWFSDGGPYPAPFDQRFHLLLNVAVGGNLPGPPDASTQFPQQMVVDYVRVYQQEDFSACIVEFDGMDHANPFGNGWFEFSGSVGGGGIGANEVDLPPIDGCRASLQSGWGSGGRPGFFGGFGRTRPLDLTDLTHFTLWIHPDPGQEYTLEINLQEDDDGDGTIPGTPDGADDEFQFDCLVSAAGPHAISGGGWQRLSIPLASFVDDNSFHFGGNGILDPFPVAAGGNGELINVVIAVISTSGSDVTFRTDRWAFTRQTSSVAGRVWDDVDGDGVQDAAEPGINGVTLELYDVALGSVVASASTAGNGEYSVAELLGALYEVRVDAATLPEGIVPTFDPDGIASAGQFALTLACDENASDQSFGYAATPTDVPRWPDRAAVLRQNFPNPFNPRTVIEFELPEEGFAELVVHDVAGRRVKTLLREWLSAGPQRVEWNGVDERGDPVAGGVYYYTLRIAQERLWRRMVLVK
ncbi:MAG: family 16 glycosylhydrolase [Candidatus Latescibacterota bacterium]|nr:MAG: family 16 glycosylhydrolase [Candidatus Latescibacterota bacterium]